MKLVLALLGIAMAAQGGLIVVPPANDAVEGTGAADLGDFFFGTSFTTQMLLPSSMLGALVNGNQITGIAFRLDSTASTTPASTLNFSTYDLVLSQPSATYSSTLGTLFASNIGAGAILVRSGALSIAANSYTGGGSPNAFGPVIAFTTPYTYTGGSILVTLSYNGGSGPALVLDSDANSLGTELYAGAFGATSGNSSIGRIPVTALEVASVPEPGTFELFALGITFLFLRRKLCAR